LTEAFVARVVSSAEAAASKRRSQRRVAALRGRDWRAEAEYAFREEWASLARAVAEARAAARKGGDWEASFDAAEALVAATKDEAAECEDCGNWKFATPAMATNALKRDLLSLGAGARREAALAWSRRSERPTTILAKVLGGDVKEHPDDAEVWAARAAAFVGYAGGGKERQNPREAKRDDDDDGSAAATLGSRLLVEMHLEKAAEVDPSDDDAKEAYDKARTRNDDLARFLLLDDDDDDDVDVEEEDEEDSDDEPRRPPVPPPRKAGDLSRALGLCTLGDAFMREGFYLASATKFEAALAELDAIVDASNIRRARLACHLNIAACYALRGIGPLDDARVEEHTTASLDIDATNVPALLRRADARQRRGRFDAARRDLCRAIDLLGDDKDRVAKAQARLDHLDFLQESAKL